jgi:serine/threonine protein kinase/Flp pilus assembly protein TadD
MNAEARKVRSIFLAAVESNSPEQRNAYLDEACAGDEELRRRVEVLLQAHEQPNSLLDRPPAALVATTDEHAVGEGPSTVIGPYKLMEQIGEGGMGLVFVAEQTQPVRRRVALKIIKPGMDTREVIARFEAERQALALMDHPNIARVFDGGATDSGRPYFVMELVKGLPITQFCDEHHLTPRERLELFIDVVQAVQHAHTKGVIHRDLKPSNVLVASHDGKPVVKVIDFGIAKAIGRHLTDKTVYTGLAQLIGTPLYMSPEQAGLSSLDIDTRTDVYALGVLLYELLTGTTPFDAERLRQAAYDEMRRIIREEEPPKPSTPISALGQAATTISARRRSDPKRLSRLFRGELDWVVMKALEKDRDHRYETANGLALDIQRYLADEPVLACPPSALYRLRKFARRNKTALTMAALILFCIGLLGAGGGWMIRDQAAREEEAARDRADRQARATRELERALDQAELFLGQGQRAEALAAGARAEFLAGQSAPEASLERRLAALKDDQAFLARFDDIRLRTQSGVDFKKGFTLAAAFPEFREALHGYGIELGHTPPAEVAARLRDRPDAVYRTLVAALDECLVYAPKAEVPTRRWLLAALLAADNDGWRARVRQALLDRNWEALEPLVRDVDVRQQPPSFLLVVALSFPAQKRSRQLDLLRRLRRAYPADLWANMDLAGVLDREGHSAEAVRYYTAALVLRPDNAGILIDRAQALGRAGETDAAIADYAQAISLAPAYPTAHFDLGVTLHRQGKLDEAVACYRKAIALDPGFVEAYINLGNALTDKGDLKEAIRCYRHAINLTPDSALAHNNLGHALRLQGEPGAAVAELREAIRFKKAFAEAHNNLGIALHVMGRLDEAIAAYQEAIRLKEDFAEPHGGLGVALKAKGRLDEAIAEYRRAIRLKPDYAEAQYNLGNALRDKDDTAAAEAAYREAIRLKPDYAEAHCNLGQLLREAGRFREALDELRRGDELGSRIPGWRNPSAEWVRQCERLLELDDKLPGFLERKAEPAGPGERIELAGLCTTKRLYCAADHFYEEAFAEQPKLADDLAAGHRYNAACAAALAGCGQGKDAEKLNGAERARLRRQALNWLRADLDAWRRRLDKESDKVCPELVQQMRHWQGDPDLAGVRGPEALARLPEGERPAWREFWAGVAGTLARGQAKTK